VLFYFSSTPSSSTALSILNTVARRLRSRFPNFAFQHCDGDLPVNKAEFTSAGFSQPGEWFFTSTPTEGISQLPPHSLTAQRYAPTLISAADLSHVCDVCEQ
jgi:hypothetical protein